MSGGQARLVTRRNVDESGTDDEPCGVEHAVGVPAGGSLAKRRHLPRGDVQRGGAIHAVPRIDHAPVSYFDLHPIKALPQFPARMLITAIRTAMPKVTCRITECLPSATAESISTPRFIGPGCMTIASGLASFNFSTVSP